MKAYALVGALGLVWIGAGAGQEGGGHPSDKGHVVVRPDAIKWGPGPASLPAGAQLAVLTGNPGKKGPFVMRAKLPAGYKVPPHSHPSDENVTVLKGVFLIGRGEELDPEKTE